MKAEEEDGGGWRIKVKDVGGDTGMRLAFTGWSSYANFGTAAYNTQYVRGCLSLISTYFCLLSASDTCLS